LFTGLNRVTDVILPLSLSVTREGNGNTGRGNGGRGREQRKQGPQGTDTMQQGHQQEEQEHPDTKSLKNPHRTNKTTPPPIENKSLWVCKIFTCGHI
jgi:hypothetical protein